MRVALYARVSSEQQEQRGTVASQLAALRGYAQQHQMDICDDYVCVDEGYSGTRLARPGLDRLRDGADLGAFDAVLVLCPDRLARKYAYQVLIIEELDRLGVAVHFLESPPPTDPHAQLLVQIQGVIAEYERAKITERYRRGKLFRLRQGEAIYWRVPYGYRRVPRQGSLPPSIEIDESTARWVQQIFRWHVDEHLTLRALARRLMEMGVPTPRDSHRWGTSTLSRILHNSAYLGAVTYNQWEVEPCPPVRGGQPRSRRRLRVQRSPKDWITLSIPPLIDEGTFAQSQDIYWDNTRFSPRHLHEERWLLRGLVRCGSCDAATSCHRMRGRNGATHDYYYCRRHDPVREGDTVCTQRHIRAREFDAFVWREVCCYLGDPATLTRAYALLSADGGGLNDDAATARAHVLDRRQRDLDQEATRLLDAYQAGLIDLPQFASRQTLLREKRDRLEREQRLLTEQQTAADRQRTICANLEAFSQQIRGRLQYLTFTEQQQVLRLVIEKVMVRDHHVSIYFKIPIESRPRPVPAAPVRESLAAPVSTGFDLRSTHDDQWALLPNKDKRWTKHGGMVDADPPP
jgi:site-specific DNA recombinase